MSILCNRNVQVKAVSLYILQIYKAISYVLTLIHKYLAISILPAQFDTDIQPLSSEALMYNVVKDLCMQCIFLCLYQCPEPYKSPW